MYHAFKIYAIQSFTKNDVDNKFTELHKKIDWIEDQFTVFSEAVEFIEKNQTKKIEALGIEVVGFGFIVGIWGN